MRIHTSARAQPFKQRHPGNRRSTGAQAGLPAHVLYRHEIWDRGVAELEAEMAPKRRYRHPFENNGVGYCEQCGTPRDARYNGRLIHGQHRHDLEKT